MNALTRLQLPDGNYLSLIGSEFFDSKKSRTFGYEESSEMIKNILEKQEVGVFFDYVSFNNLDGKVLSELPDALVFNEMGPLKLDVPHCIYINDREFLEKLDLNQFSNKGEVGLIDGKVNLVSSLYSTQ